MAGATAGAIVSSFVKPWADQACSLAQEEIAKFFGVEEDLEKLLDILLFLDRVHEDAEQKQYIDKAVKRWLTKFRAAAYDAEDVLEDISTENSRRSRTDEESASTVFDVFDVFNDYKMGDRVKNINTKLENLKKQMEGLGLQAVPRGGQNGPAPAEQYGLVARETISSLEKDVFGRIEEKEAIIKQLLSSGEEPGTSSNRREGGEKVSLIPIVGMGGVGKTTLARMVFNDERVQEHFTFKKWICVSENFDVGRLIQEIIGESQSQSRLEDLKDKLGETPRKERFLIVLDDVWCENKEVWQTLWVPLDHPEGLGGKVIVTSRSEKVPNAVFPVQSNRLMPMSDEDCWLIFEKGAFENGDSSKYPDLKRVGVQIVKKLKGIPLAVKAVAGFLCNIPEVDYWKSLLGKNIWQLYDETNILPILRLSYQHLPAQLRRCFAYCCLFPKGWKLDKWTLIRQWMAQGYLHGSQGRMEDVGNLYFNDLVKRSFLECVRGYRFISTAYVIHDLMHDLAESVSMGECLIFGENESAVVPENVRHVLFRSLRLVKKTDIPKFQKLRSCLISGHEPDLNLELLTQMLCHMKSVRVLDIDIDVDKGYNLPDAFGGLRHLRYLHLRGGWERLPNSICGLYNLQTLSIDENHIFPKAMNKLVNLRHLIVFPDSDISGIDRLTSLQELTYIVKGQNIGELHNINQLRGVLSIRCLEEVGSKEEAMEADLKAKVYLDDLSLSWTTSREPVEPSTDSRRGRDDKVIDALVPPPNLTKLMVVGNQGTRPPRWMKGLTNLTDLRLVDFHGWEQLPPVEHLPRLRHLVVSGMPRVKRVEWKVGIMGADLFPVLETLELSRMTELEECVVSPPAEDGISGGDRHAFPSLRRLSVSDCPKLRMLPCFVSLRMSRLEVTSRDVCGYMTDMSRLHVTSRDVCGYMTDGDIFRYMRDGEVVLSFKRCPMLVSNIPLFPKQVEAVRSLNISERETGQRIQRVLQRFSSVEELMVFKCPGIRVLPDNGLSPLLRKLNIFSCRDLQSLPAGMHLLSSLQELRISSCRQIQALPDNGLPPSLYLLEVELCEGLQSLPAGMHLLSSLQELSIAYCPQIQALTDNGLPSSLCRLEVKSCKGLQSLPARMHLLSSLQKLEMSGCPQIQALPAGMNLLSSLQELRIASCPQIQALADNGLPPSLFRLEVKSCEGLQSLPAGMHLLSSLQTLEISGCPQIQALPENGLPPSLRMLCINECPQLEERCQEETGLDWPKIAHLPKRSVLIGASALHWRFLYDLEAGTDLDMSDLDAGDMPATNSEASTDLDSGDMPATNSEAGTDLDMSDLDAGDMPATNSAAIIDRDASDSGASVDQFTSDSSDDIDLT